MDRKRTRKIVSEIRIAKYLIHVPYTIWREAPVRLIQRLFSPGFGELELDEPLKPLADLLTPLLSTVRAQRFA